MLLSQNRPYTLVVLVLVLVLVSGVLYNTIDAYLPRGLRYGLLTPQRESNLEHLLTPQDHVNRAPNTVHYVWKITTGFRAPDGVRKKVYLINGSLQRCVIQS